MKILLSAYSCAPERGSEPGAGWNMAREAANYHEVWVLTRSKNRPLIEAELARNPIPGLHFVYFDLPRWARWWKRGQRGLTLYYYLWQLGTYQVARRLHRKVGIDLAHHVTFGVHWRPGLLALLPVPFIWGPVGGGESAPSAFWRGFDLRGKVYETKRELARWLGEHDPFVRITARRSVRALATTEETITRLRKLDVKDVRVLPQVGLGQEDIDRLRRQEVLHELNPVRFVSIGRLLHWKGFDLGLRAFAQARLSDAEYWVIGDGPELKRLQVLAEKLGIAHRAKFWGLLSRSETLQKLGACHVLVHPSLHESGGAVCLEAMASRHPVICLDLGGPAVQVTEKTGFKIPAVDPEQAVSGLAVAMQRLGKDHELRTYMGEAARRRVAEHFNWNEKGAQIAELYREAREAQLR
jgi:glycosyltransferase involved in cell wall biosynthesis